MAVVKADGYGHGAIEVALKAIEAGADYLGVAFVDEALQLRNAGLDIPILILGNTPSQAIEAAIRHRITVAVSSCDSLADVVLCAERLGQQARVHLKVDTGMSRLGFQTDEVLPLFLTYTSPQVMIEGIFTHFADADNPDPSFTKRQYNEFASLNELLSANGIHISIKHCCNSAATMKFTDMHMDMVRVGIALYGLSPLPGESLPSYPLWEAMQFKTTISFLHTVKKNQPVGYGLTYRTKRDSQQATLPAGYADGLSRQRSKNGYLLIRGTRAPNIGKV